MPSKHAKSFLHGVPNPVEFWQAHSDLSSLTAGSGGQSLSHLALLYVIPICLCSYISHISPCLQIFPSSCSPHCLQEHFPSCGANVPCVQTGGSASHVLLSPHVRSEVSQISELQKQGWDFDRKGYALHLG